MTVSVIMPVIVAALLNGNDAVGVIDAVDDDATGGWDRPDQASQHAPCSAKGHTKQELAAFYDAAEGEPRR